MHQYGFDTFTGLPEKWVRGCPAVNFCSPLLVRQAGADLGVPRHALQVRDDNSHWEVNTFDQGGFPEVESNVHLVRISRLRQS